MIDRIKAMTSFPGRQRILVIIPYIEERRKAASGLEFTGHFNGQKPSISDLLLFWVYLRDQA